MELIEDAVTAAAAGGLGPLTTGRTFCNMLSTCEQLGDLSRALEWHAVVETWGEPHAGSAFPGICRVHRAGMLRLRGDLPAATVEATRAAEELEGFLFDIAGEAFYELGEIHLRKGDLRTAEAMLEEAHVRGRNPQPGLALLRLNQGNGDAAWSMIEGALAGKGTAALDRAKLLPAAIEIAVAGDRLGTAANLVAELESITKTYNSPALVAAAALGRGRLELAYGKATEALPQLRHAQRIWAKIELPYELASTRVLLAQAHSLAGEVEQAELEDRAAEATLRRIGAALKV
jgi:tetratricopeptide (TPR) repeat protein